MSDTLSPDDSLSSDNMSDVMETESDHREGREPAPEPPPSATRGPEVRRRNPAYGPALFAIAAGIQRRVEGDELWNAFWGWQAYTLDVLRERLRNEYEGARRHLVRAHQPRDGHPARLAQSVADQCAWNPDQISTTPREELENVLHETWLDRDERWVLRPYMRRGRIGRRVDGIYAFLFDMGGTAALLDGSEFAENRLAEQVRRWAIRRSQQRPTGPYITEFVMGHVGL